MDIYKIPKGDFSTYCYSAFDKDKVANRGFDLSYKDGMNLSDELKRFKQLHSAVKWGQKKTIESLLEAGAPVNRHPVWFKFETPLHLAVHFGDPEIVAKLLSKGASVDAYYRYNTPLLVAAKLEKYEIVDLLLLAKGLKNCTDKMQMTHFHVACMRNQVEVAKTLLHCEEDVNAAVNSDSDFWPGFTALHFAVRFQNLEAVEFLLSVGADITIKDARQLTPLHLAHKLMNWQIVDVILMHHIEIVSNPVDSDGLSHFHIACTRNQPNVVEHFIEIGAYLRDPITKEYHFYQKMAIDLAIRHECIDVLRLLLHYWDLELSENGEEYNRISNAYRAGNPEIIDLLMMKSNLSQSFRKFEPNFLHFLTLESTESIEKFFSRTPISMNSPITSTGCTPLHSAIECRSQKLIKFLLDKGADHTIQDIRGKSPLHLAFEHNMTELVDLMLTNQRLPSQNIADNNGLSHLHIACARNNVNVVESLLKLGADVNSQVNDNAVFWPGFGPLHFAAKFGSDKVVQYLLEYGATYWATNASNLSAFDIAFMESNANRDRNAFDCMKLILTFHQSQCKYKYFNDRGVSLLHLACITISSSPFCTEEEMAKLLDTHAADVNKSIHQMDTDWDGCTALHFAVQQTETRGHASLLLKAGADVLAQNSKGDTPMHMIDPKMLFNNWDFAYQDLRILQLNHIGSRGLSIFHKACGEGNLDLMKFFLEHGVDPNFPSLARGLGCNDSTPLHLVITSGIVSNVDAIKLLLDNGADPNAMDFQKNTPLHQMRSCYRYPEVIEILVSHGADIDALNAQLETPLVSLLVELEDQINDSGDYIRHIELFLDNGANTDLADERGATVFSAAYGWACLDPSDEPNYPDAVDIIGIFLKHVIKLRCLGFEITNKTNKEYHTSLLKLYSEDLNLVESTFIEKCNHELALMKRSRIDSYTTLHDILLGSPNKLAVTSQNSAFENVVNSTDFCEKYPVYGGMLKSRLTQGQVRWRLLKESMKGFNSLLDITLPQICSENIFQSLSNHDLRSIIKCVKNS